MSETHKNSAPVVFISHASEDKARFVLAFATRLREKGVEAWLDHWEIKAGDSLVEKIFEEGIKKAEVFIVVLSAQSVGKKWVREELDSGMVSKIQKSCRLIPVIIDECEVPHTLKHLKWVRIKDLGDFTNELSEIVSAIFGTTDKPVLGNPPAHVTAAPINFLPSLTKSDNLVFGVFFRHYLKTGNKFIGTNEVLTELDALELGNEEIGESLEILSSRCYLGIKRAGETIYLVEMYPSLLTELMPMEIPEYHNHVVTIISKIVNENVHSSNALNQSTGIAVPVILQILEWLESKGLVSTISPSGVPICQITQVSAELKRILRGMQES